ncbi:MAG: preprotein translocase subunit SecE [Anaerolineae bacterium]|nr:preprotein translocase subunit SecE [Anaerolineae bacterium]MCB9131238.1 preprotein translocase subunit SecE [Anaerolineales bacterium]MCB0227682.1 preprotein translocase subunit SecE [Anaerolineae bacterium]MCB0238536.1 preprotein translocase subunit SecE [Anaerolineae bacterium]MCB0241946.1 preprotein translocase subunit SecE [Anaerolineae bacterium]
MTSVTKAETEKQENRLTRYLRESRAEMRKVTWPTREEAINLTSIVLIVTFLMSLFLWGLDVVFDSIMLRLIG